MNVVLKRQRSELQWERERWCWDIFGGGREMIRWAKWPFPIQQFLLSQCRMTMGTQWQRNLTSTSILKEFQLDRAALLWIWDAVKQARPKFPTCPLFCCCCYCCLFPFTPFYSPFFLSWLWWGLFLCKTSPSDLFERPALVILPDHHCMTCFYIRLTKELFDQGVWCVIVRNSASRWQPLFPKAAPWPHSIQGKTPLEWPLFIE